MTHASPLELLEQLVMPVLGIEPGTQIEDLGEPSKSYVNSAPTDERHLCCHHRDRLNIGVEG